MTDENLVLLNPGPANTSARVRAALGRGDLCHREPEFAHLLGSIRSGLVEALNLADSHEAVVISGSGTAAVEMSLLASVRPNRSVLVLSNGAYGERMRRMCEAHGISTYEVTASWDQPIDPGAVLDVLATHPDIDAVAVVMHETSAGLINPVREIGEIVAGTEAVFVVDAISATGHEEPDLGTIHADLICGTANKGLHGLPGASFVLVSAQKGAARIAAVPSRSTYLDLAANLAAQRAGDVLFTPAVQVYYALDDALKELREQGGYPARSADYQRRAQLLRTGLERLGLELLVAPEYRSNSVSTVLLPPGVPYQRLHDELKRRGFVIYAGQGRLAAGHFRVANMGQLSLTTLERFLAELEDTLELFAGSSPAQQNLPVHLRTGRAAEETRR
ncbi:aminotransferase class V-fold PLP-dependent enzyme [Micromonospora sp. WMMD1120]|uniref:pyridoxal-phosphate-dependent aminotransferase family protein n=1 Tax=Micromonospora sp. WMMD1120 TaxID=3016106 RepID=UPI00241607C6|nr:aminotransferase class V-fold PLP-dependent enzyme [Micromonospora sp. WMMD1120]MDG4808716.1 aminotransferase class V-fold PLP-dependent enzyme [Micromonospora sp. WMMD1120]